MKENIADSQSVTVRRERDPDMAGAEQALRRAADKARQKARQFGHGIMIWKDGKVIEEGKDCSAND